MRRACKSFRFRAGACFARDGRAVVLDLKAVGLSTPPDCPGGSHPDPEYLFHWPTTVPGGFRVAEVWTPRAKWDAFEAAGQPAQMGTPKKDFHEVVSYLTQPRLGPRDPSPPFSQHRSVLSGGPTHR